MSGGPVVRHAPSASATTVAWRQNERPWILMEPRPLPASTSELDRSVEGGSDARHPTAGQPGAKLRDADDAGVLSAGVPVPTQPVPREGLHPAAGFISVAPSLLREPRSP